MPQKKARIIGMGSHLPDKILSNADLEKMVETSDEWITSRTGMKERRIAGEHEYTSEMGLKAAQKAIKAANITPEKVDLILFATLTSDYITPSTACLVQAELGISNAAAVDIQAACSGYLYGLSMAKAYIESGMYNNVLVIAADKLSTIVNYEDRNTCVLFGDGAGACIVSGEGEGLSIESLSLGSDGCESALLMLPAGGIKNPTSHKTVDEKLHYLHMSGKETFKHAVRRMGAAAKTCLELSGLKEDQISYLIPHQANLRIIEALARRFDLPMNKVFLTIHKYGNTSASSIAIALEELMQEKKIEKGNNLLLTAFGAGLTWGAAILKKI